MNEDTNYTQRAAMLIESVYGEPPDASSSVYRFYSEAVAVQARFLEKQDTSAGLKKLSLGDYSEEYSEGSRVSDELIDRSAQALLSAVYPKSEVTVL